MPTLFWDEWGVILEHYIPRRNTVNSATYADLKTHIHPAIKSKWCGHLSTVVLPQHDNARSHTACSTVATIQDLSFECLPHSPYLPDLTFKSFDPSKRWWEASLSGLTKRCSRRCSNSCALGQKNFFSRVIHALPKCWNTCMECSADYIEKWSHCVPFVFNKLQDKKYLRFSFDSPSYMYIACLVLYFASSNF